MEQADNSLIILSYAYNALVWVGRFIAWVLALPLRIIAAVIAWLRSKRYDPEKIMCPACGYKGEKGSNGRSCLISFIRTEGKEKAALRHTCLRCSCEFYTTKMFLPVEQWLPPMVQTKEEILKEAAKRAVL